MKIILKYLILIGYLSLLIILGCSDSQTNEQKQSEKPKDKHSNENEHSNELTLSEKQIKLMGIETEKLSNQNVSGYLQVNGEVIINPDNESKVGSLIPGRVSKIYVKEGGYVKTGQTLALIENLDLVNAQIEYLEAKHEYNTSKLEYERQRTLSSDNIGSKKELSKLKSDYEHTVVGLKSAEQKLLSYKISKSKLEDFENYSVQNELQRYYSVTSPISGTLVKRNVTIGQYIESSSDMFYIVNTSTVFIDLNVFEKDLQFISSGQKVMLDVSVNPYEQYEGIVTYINKIFDDEKRTVKVRVAINNKNEKLLPFMFVSAKIFVKEESVLAVPLTAIETEGESKYIFVKTTEKIELEKHDEHDEEKSSDDKKINNEDEHKEETGVVFKKVLVNTGISDDKYVQIFPVEDLKPGESFVTKGTFYLKSELKKGELGDEH
jgi:membrane fusion protein, heavy metal efflux system